MNKINKIFLTLTFVMNFSLEVKYLDYKNQLQLQKNYSHQIDLAKLISTYLHYQKYGISGIDINCLKRSFQ